MLSSLAYSCDVKSATDRPSFNGKPPNQQQARQLESTLEAVLALISPGTCAPLLHDDALLLQSVQRQLDALAALARPAASAPAAALEESSGSQLDCVDDALVGYMLLFLSAEEVTKARRVCRRLLRLASGREVWRPLSQRDWPWIDSLTLATALLEQEAGDAQALDTVHYRLYRQRTLAHRLVRPPLPARPAVVSSTSLPLAERKPLSDLQLLVDVREIGSNKVLYSACGRLPEDEAAFRDAVFSFDGLVLDRNSLVDVPVDRPWIFKDLQEALFMLSALRLDFALFDTKTGRMADLSSVLRPTAMTVESVLQYLEAMQQPLVDPTPERAAEVVGKLMERTRASVGWTTAGNANLEEIWVFAQPDSVFLQGEIRLLRGLTVKVVPARVNGLLEGVELPEGIDGLVVAHVTSAWLCDHQYLGGPKPSIEDLRAVIFEELKWV